MGRYFFIPIPATAVTAAIDVAEIIVPSGARVRLHETKLTQNTEDATSESEQLRVTISRFASGYTGGSGGASATPVALDSGDPASGVSVEVFNTTAASGTSALIDDESFNVLSGYRYAPPVPPDRKPAATGGEAFVVRMADAPTDSITFSGGVIIEVN